MSKSGTYKFISPGVFELIEDETDEGGSYVFVGSTPGGGEMLARLKRKIDAERREASLRQAIVKIEPIEPTE